MSETIFYRQNTLRSKMKTWFDIILPVSSKHLEDLKEGVPKCFMVIVIIVITFLRFLGTCAALLNLHYNVDLDTTGKHCQCSVTNRHVLDHRLSGHFLNLK